MGTFALYEIHKYQKGIETLLQKLPFQRLIKEITQEFSGDLRWTSAGIQPSQEAANFFPFALTEFTQPILLLSIIVVECFMEDNPTAGKQ